ncbi:hypothetical protein SZ28_31470, partial [Burkholderia pseudomallei]
TVQVAPQEVQVQALLARHLTPSSFQVEGVKSIPFEEISQRFTPLVGKDITIGQLIETANGVTKLYQERGYALSFAFVPAQTFEGGVVRVTVVEGYVANLKITGRPGAMEPKVRAIAAHIMADRIVIRVIALLLAPQKKFVTARSRCRRNRCVVRLWKEAGRGSASAERQRTRRSAA